MVNNIRMFMSETSDLTITQAIERYREMDSDEATAVITAEWPEQMAAVLRVFIAQVDLVTTKKICRVEEKPRRTCPGCTYITLPLLNKGYP